MNTPRLDPLPAGLHTLADHERLAGERLDASAWAYFQGGAADEITHRANRRAWDGLRLLPRVLRALAGGHTRHTLWGRPMACPLLLAPVAWQCMAHPDGEVASAAAASALGVGMVLSTQSSTPLAEVARAFQPGDTGSGPFAFQLYWQRDRDFNLTLLERARAAGAHAIVLTVDAPVQGVRDRERQAGFRRPPHIHSMPVQDRPPAPPAAPLAPGQSALFDGLLSHAPSWDEVAWLQRHTPLPLVLKGVLHPDDARQAVDLGVGGLIVSNHGGRTLDTALPTAQALPAIARAVNGQVPLLVDGGIRRGTDVLKALALGASAVLVGRPVVHGLACGGAAGVAQMLRLLRDEFEIAMALTGCRTLDDIGPDLLVM